MTTQERIKEIRDNPDKHRHQDLDGVIRCSMHDGAINTAIMQAHQDYASHGSNGGVKCDVSRGPCSCGAWH